MEDDALIALALELGLTEAGFRVSLAGDGAEALTLLEAGGVDMLLTDLIMPDMDGFQLFEAVRARWPLLPVVVITGYAWGAERFGRAIERLREAGVRIIFKPAYVDQVLEVLRSEIRS